MQHGCKFPVLFWVTVSSKEVIKTEGAVPCLGSLLGVGTIGGQGEALPPGVTRVSVKYRADGGSRGPSPSCIVSSERGILGLAGVRLRFGEA